jgi:hypothetical protein
MRWHAGVQDQGGVVSVLRKPVMNLICGAAEHQQITALISRIGPGPADREVMLGGCFRAKTTLVGPFIRQMRALHRGISRGLAHSRFFKN